MKIQQLFIEKEDKLVFTPIQISLNSSKIEKAIDKVISFSGKPYKMNQFEKDILEELDF
jgi:hypothetical protein